MDMIAMPLPAAMPQSVVRLIALIGYDATMALVKHCPGLTLPIPKSGGDTGASQYAYLVETVGAAAADILVQHYGGDRLSVPRCYQLLIETRWRAIILDYNAGIPVRELALKYTLTERSIWNVLKRAVDLNRPAVLAQDDLFAGSEQ